MTDMIPSNGATKPMAIVASHVASVAGEHTAALHAAVTVGMSGTALQQSDCYAVGESEQTPSPVIAAPMALMAGTRNQCLSELLIRALLPIIPLMEEWDEEAPLVSVLLPLDSEHCARAKRLDSESIREMLTEAFPLLRNAQIRFVSHTRGATAEYLYLQQRLSQGEAKSALLCGADSLVNTVTYLDLAEREQLATRNNRTGVVPGEAAGVVCIRQLDACGAEQPTPLARITGSASLPEPHAGQAAHKHLQAVAQAFQQATTHQPELLRQAATLFQSHSLGIEGDLEWQQVSRQLWPNRLPEQQRVAMMLNEVDIPLIKDHLVPHLYNLSETVGEIGAASLPVQLALACEQFRHEAHLSRFGFPAPRASLVCEMGDYPLRGALCLEPMQA